MLIKLFYLVKPFVSRRLQFRIRRLMVRSKLKRYRNVWPIDERASAMPNWFAGWPEGKKFSLLITHDVEQVRGLRKIEALITMDEKYGMQSAFGLVPERYEVTPDVIDLLKAHKRELYVHDLNHDGKLFSNYSLFHQRVKWINHYLHSWKAEGFRAGAMHHNLDWIGELDINYDMSTFDTDPFEPMPDGVSTIFPFVATSYSTNRTYVEIPYTLPQDLMSLVLHPSRSIDLWKKKVEWIAKQSGMVLVNVHPDYIAFNNAELSFDTYSINMYEEFLKFIQENYQGTFWNPTPKEMCIFINKAADHTSLKK